MALSDHLPINESLGVFVGVSGFDWLTEGQAAPMKALLTAVSAGGIILIARLIQRQRKRN